MKYPAQASLIMSAASLGALYIFSKTENGDIFQEITKCMKKYDKNSDYNSRNYHTVENFAKYCNNINAYVKLIETNCSDSAVKELEENNLLTDNIKSWIRDYKKDVSFLDYFNNF